MGSGRGQLSTHVVTIPLKHYRPLPAYYRPLSLLVSASQLDPNFHFPAP